jgi:16S rRNA (uracil1498-N3)-methyltransferase
MAVPRFYLSAPIAPDVVGTSLALPEDVAHHAVRVLRLAVGAPIRLFDGQGGEYRAAIDRIDRHGASARIDRFDPVDREWAGAPTLVQAIIAADAMDAAVRKAVELGVAGIVPVLAARSQGAPAGARAEKRLFHWRSIAIAACEQCGRNRVPPIAEPVAFDGWLRTAEAVQGPAVVAAPGAGVSLADFATRTRPRVVAVGPEGGFTEQETAQAVARGFVPVHMGPRILRADTAAIAALAMLAAVGGDAR